MNSDQMLREVATLCLMLEEHGAKSLFDGEVAAEMFNQILAGHTAESVAGKHGLAAGVSHEKDVMPQFKEALGRSEEERYCRAWTDGAFRCETCQSQATIHVPVIGCHFCARCLDEINAKLRVITGP